MPALFWKRNPLSHETHVQGLRFPAVVLFAYSIFVQSMDKGIYRKEAFDLFVRSYKGMHLGVYM